MFMKNKKIDFYPYIDHYHPDNACNVFTVVVRSNGHVNSHDSSVSAFLTDRWSYNSPGLLGRSIIKGSSLSNLPTNFFLDTAGLEANRGTTPSKRRQ